MEMFKKLGPRVILVELRGKVAGLVTVKDVLKYQFKVESEEHPRVERYTGTEERIWGFIEASGRRIGGIWDTCLRRKGVRPGSSEDVARSEDEVELVDRLG